MEENELNALLKLLSDDDEYVSGMARTKLLSEFEQIEDDFNQAIASSADEGFIEKAYDVYSEYNFLRTKNELEKWINSSSKDFIKGIYIINKLYNPDLEQQSIYNLIDRLKRKFIFDVKNLSPIEQIRALNFVFFKENNFKIIFEPQTATNSLITSILSHKKASPILITIVYFLLAKKLDIPLYLIYSREILLLGYFLNASDAQTQKHYLSKNINYSFFVNVSDRGYIYTNQEIKIVLTKYKIKSTNDFFIVTPTRLVNILINKLIVLSLREKNVEMHKYLVELQKLIV